MNDDLRPVETRTEAAPIGRASLHDQLVARLRTLIVEGEISPGAAAE